jgi:hypothetical protein
MKDSASAVRHTSSEEFIAPLRILDAQGQVVR